MNVPSNHAFVFIYSTTNRVERAVVAVFEWGWSLGLAQHLLVFPAAHMQSAVRAAKNRGSVSGITRTKSTESCKVAKQDIQWSE